MSRRGWVDFAVTIVVAVVLAFLIAWGLLAWAFSGWGDRPVPVSSPTPTLGAAVVVA